MTLAAALTPYQPSTVVHIPIVTFRRYQNVCLLSTDVACGTFLRNFRCWHTQHTLFTTVVKMNATMEVPLPCFLRLMLDSYIPYLCLGLDKHYSTTSRSLGVSENIGRNANDIHESISRGAPPVQKCFCKNSTTLS